MSLLQQNLFTKKAETERWTLFLFFWKYYCFRIILNGFFLSSSFLENVFEKAFRIWSYKYKATFICLRDLLEVLFSGFQQLLKISNNLWIFPWIFKSFQQFLGRCFFKTYVLHSTIFRFEARFRDFDVLPPFKLLRGFRNIWDA